MPVAFVLINAEIGSEDDVLQDLKTNEAVKEAYVVYGVYDIICKISQSTMDMLKETITTKIRGLENVRSTLTMIVVEGSSNQ